MRQNVLKFFLLYYACYYSHTLGRMLCPSLQSISFSLPHISVSIIPNFAKNLNIWRSVGAAHVIINLHLEKPKPAEIYRNQELTHKPHTHKLESWLHTHAHTEIQTHTHTQVVCTHGHTHTYCVWYLFTFFATSFIISGVGGGPDPGAGNICCILAMNFSHTLNEGKGIKHTSNNMDIASTVDDSPTAYSLYNMYLGTPTKKWGWTSRRVSPSDPCNYNNHVAYSDVLYKTLLVRSCTGTELFRWIFLNM